MSNSKKALNDNVRRSTPKKVHLPMILRDGSWEPEFGGVIPACDGARAELRVQLSDIADQDFIRRVTSKSTIRILDRGEKLRVYLATKTLQGVSDDQRSVLQSWNNVGREIAPLALDNWSSGGIHFVDLTISGPTEKQSLHLLHRDGGLWLTTEGTKATGLMSSLIELPKFVSEEPAISLNHAFTLLSETYEPWRKSHTGNVYTRFLYKESNDLWYPLELLRNAELAQKEQEIAAGLWNRFMQQMTSKS